MKWGIVDRISIDFADVKVLFDFGDAVGLDAVGHSPDLVRSRVVVVGQLLPEGTRYQRDNPTRGLGSTTVVLADAENCRVSRSFSKAREFCFWSSVDNASGRRYHRHQTTIVVEKKYDRGNSEAEIPGL